MARNVMAQDDARENRIVDLFNLTRPVDRTRHGTDALLLVDGHQLEFELKSVTRAGGGVSTVRDLGPDHIAKWRHKHWIIGFYDQGDLTECRYGTPEAMAPWIARIWEYIRIDFEMAQLAPALITMKLMQTLLGVREVYGLQDAKRLHKQQFTAARYRSLMDVDGGYSAERMLEIMRERAKYVMERGSTLNNPHIPTDYFSEWPCIRENHAVRLRELVRAWLATAPPERLVQPGMP